MHNKRMKEHKDYTDKLDAYYNAAKKRTITEHANNTDWMEKIAKEKLNEGRKDDSGKLEWHLLDWKSLEEVVEVMMHGKKKYGEYNWQKGISFSRLWDAANRHLKAFWSEKDNDDETNKSHIAHAICCCMMLLWTLKSKPELDDRRK